VDVRLGFVRYVEVDDVRNALDVDPARRDVRRDQDPVIPAPETLEGMDPLALASISMDYARGDVRVLKVADQAVRPALGPDEHEHARHRSVLEKLDEDPRLLHGRGSNREVGDADRRHRFRGHVDHPGVAQEIPREANDLGGHRGGE
jgi:hypothetical protein